jgi:hypothetical protein
MLHFALVLRPTFVPEEEGVNKKRQIKKYIFIRNNGRG